MKKKPRLRYAFLLLLSVSIAANSRASNPNVPTPILIKKHTTHHMRKGDSFIATLQAETFLQAEVSVEYATGKVLMRKPFVLDPGSNSIKFKLTEIPSGFYLIRVLEPLKTEVFTIVVH